MAIEARITLKTGEAPAVGRERIRLLEAVAREGSITAGARAAGLTYKAAWDALDAMGNLFGQPLLKTHAGGKSGGGATLTPAGVRVIQAFHKLEAEMARSVRSIEPDLAGAGISPFDLFSGFFMRTSARNALRGTVTELVPDALASGGCRLHRAEHGHSRTCYERKRAGTRSLCGPRRHCTRQGALRHRRARQQGAAAVGPQPAARDGSAMRGFGRECGSRDRHRRREVARRVHHCAERQGFGSGAG